MTIMAKAHRTETKIESETLQHTIPMMTTQHLRKTAIGTAIPVHTEIRAKKEDRTGYTLT